MPNHLDDDTLNEYLDSALDAARRAEVDAHLTACVDCAARVEKLRLLFTAIESAPHAPLHRDFSASVVAALQERHQPAPVLLPQLRVAFAMQAIVALILFAFAAPIAMQALPVSETPQFTQQVFDAIADTLAEWSASLALARQTVTNAASALNDLPLPALSLLALSLGGLAVTLMWLVGNGLLITQLNRRPTQQRI